MRWNFKDMAVGDVMEIYDSIARAQIYVHVYGRSAGKKFVTDTQTGVLRIERLPDDGGAGVVVGRSRHPIWDMEVGDVSVFAHGDFGLTAPNTVAYRVSSRTGRKFKCRKVEGEMSWRVERVS